MKHEMKLGVTHAHSPAVHKLGAGHLHVEAGADGGGVSGAPIAHDETLETEHLRVIFLLSMDTFASTRQRSDAVRKGLHYSVQHEDCPVEARVGSERETCTS